MHGLSKNIKAHLRDFFYAEPQHLVAVVRRLRPLAPDDLRDTAGEDAIRVLGTHDTDDSAVDHTIAWLGTLWRRRPETGWVTLAFLAHRHLAGVMEDKADRNGRPTYVIVHAAPWVRAPAAAAPNAAEDQPRL